MSNELMLVLAVAGAAAFAGGGLFAWITRRPGKRLDPAEESVRQIELLELRDSLVKAQNRAAALEKQLFARQAEHSHAASHIASLEEQVAAYLRQYAQAKQALKREILQKSSFKTELAATTAQVQALQGRIQELEMERASATGTRPRLHA